MSSTDRIKSQETTPVVDELRACAAKLGALETLPKPYDLYYAIKNQGYMSGWSYACAGIGVAGIRAAVDLIDAQHALIEQLYAKLTCCCGSYVADHGMGDGHSSVAMYDYALQNAEERIKQLEAKADPVIRLTGSEVQSGHDRQKWAEDLILQLPADHDGRNSWLLNYGVSDDAKTRREKRGLDFNPVSHAVNPPADR